MMGTIIAEVIRGEGLLSAVRRTNERIAEASRNAALRARGAFVKAEEIAILNVSAASVSARRGGVPVQLIARLAAERTLRSVALLRPGALELSAPVLHTRAIAGDFESAVGQALSITGARSLHLEGTDGVPIASMLRLIESGIRVVVSVHDFSLFCARPHLLELPMERFCFYSRDLDRCHRCLRQTWDVTRDDQADRRAMGRELLAAATGVIFPSQFLLDQHRELFSLPQLAGEIIEPGVPAAGGDVRVADVRPAIAYAGSVKRHKGAHFVPDIVRLAIRVADWHAFGGGDEDLLRAMRRVPSITVHGYYQHRRLPSLLARHRVGLVVLPSIVPEAYGLVLSEAWLAGAAVVALDHGAMAERIRRDGGGWLAPLESGAAGLAEIVDQWKSGRIAANIPRVVTSPLDAARAHVDRYRRWGLL
jgi:glycosyltransferase involved in cell wall biosynthesis